MDSFCFRSYHAIATKFHGESLQRSNSNRIIHLSTTASIFTWVRASALHFGKAEALRYNSSKSIQEAALKYSKKSRSFIIDMSIIIFFGQFFGKMMKQFLEDINQGIYYTLCLKLNLPKPIYPQRISEFKVTIGEDLMAAIIQEIKEYLYLNLELYKVNDDLIEFVALGVSLSVNVSGIYNHYGFSKFLNFAFWHGLFAELEACIARQRQQKKYSLTDLLFTYLSKLVEHGDNMDDLEKELKNSIEEGKQIINPCAQSLRDLLADLGTEEFKKVQKILARRVSNLCFFPIT